MIRLDKHFCPNAMHGNLGCFPWGKWAVCLFFLCAVFLGFCNPPSTVIINHSRLPSFSFVWFVCFKQQEQINKNETLTWTTGSLMCVRDHSYAHGGWVHGRVSTFLLGKTHKFFLCSGWGSNLWSLDLESMLYQLSHPSPQWMTIN